MTIGGNGASSQTEERMKVYGIVATGILLNLEGEGSITSGRLFRQPPTKEQMEAFRSKLVSPEGTGARALKDLDPEKAKLHVVEFELED